MQFTGFGLAGLMLPGFGHAVAAEIMVSTMDVGLKKAIADTALNAATAAGATYCDAKTRCRTSSTPNRWAWASG